MVLKAENNLNKQSSADCPAVQMVEYALKLAAEGFHVVPLYEPVFDGGGHLVGCSCNRGKHCKNAGKHPRVKWASEATTNERQIKEWWGGWPKANIAIDCGKSGIVVLDIDSYKDICEAGDLDIDDDTVRVLTGGGGLHLYYQMPQDKRYGCSKGKLPLGVDVKGGGGYVVAPASMHKSGTRYEFECDHGPDEIEIKKLPEYLREKLDAAQPNGPVPEVNFTGASSAAPDLAKWKLSARMLGLIHNPLPKGQRSEADMAVCDALCARGATDDEILSIFTHYAIGKNGKFAEESPRYLKRTIGKARQYVSASPRVEKEEIKELRLWITSKSFKHLVLEDLQCKKGYRTDSSDTKVADALLDVAEERGSWVFRVGLKELRDRAGLGSTSTVNKAIERLKSWFVVIEDEGNSRQSKQYRIVAYDVVRSHPITIGKNCDIGCDLVTTAYSDHKGEDAFLTGYSRTAKGRQRAWKQHKRQLRNWQRVSFRNREVKLVCRSNYIGSIQNWRVMASKQNRYWNENVLKNWRYGIPTKPNTLRGIPETLLRVIDVLLRKGAIDVDDDVSMTREDLARATGKPLSSIGTATRRGVDEEILFEQQQNRNKPKRYMLSTWYLETIDKLVPNMKTYNLRLERKNRDMERIQRRCERSLERAHRGEIVLSKARRQKIEDRRAWAIEQRIPIVSELFPSWPAEEVEKFIVEPTPIAGPNPFGEAWKRKGHEVEREQYRRAHHEMLVRAESDMKKMKLPLKVWFRYLRKYLGYTEREATEIIAMHRRKRRYTYVAPIALNEEEESEKTAFA